MATPEDVIREAHNFIANAFVKQAADTALSDLVAERDQALEDLRRTDDEVQNLHAKREQWFFVGEKQLTSEEAEEWFRANGYRERREAHEQAHD